MLNEQQQIAVTTPNASALILSGAGTGKSSVLVARIQHILQQGTSPESIMAISFTNKAANEIKLRLERQLQNSVSGMWLGTFHSLCFKILVMHIKTKLSLSQSYKSQGTFFQGSFQFLLAHKKRMPNPKLLLPKIYD